MTVQFSLSKCNEVKQVDILKVAKHEFKLQCAAFAWAELLAYKKLRCKLYRTNGVWVVELN